MCIRDRYILVNIQPFWNIIGLHEGLVSGFPRGELASSWPAAGPSWHQNQRINFRISQWGIRPLLACGWSDGEKGLWPNVQSFRHSPFFYWKIPAGDTNKCIYWFYLKTSRDASPFYKLHLLKTTKPAFGWRTTSHPRSPTGPSTIEV